MIRIHFNADRPPLELEEEWRTEILDGYKAFLKDRMPKGACQRIGDSATVLSFATVCCIELISGKPKVSELTVKFDGKTDPVKLHMFDDRYAYQNHKSPISIFSTWLNGESGEPYLESTARGYVFVADVSKIEYLQSRYIDE